MIINKHIALGAQQSASGDSRVRVFFVSARRSIKRALKVAMRLRAIRSLLYHYSYAAWTISVANQA
jgi:hypothetical protein